MPWVEKSRVVRRGWIFKKKETYYEEVEVVAYREWKTEYSDWTDSGTEFLVKDKKGNMFLTSYLYN